MQSIADVVKRITNPAQANLAAELQHLLDSPSGNNIFVISGYKSYSFNVNGRVITPGPVVHNNNFSVPVGIAILGADEKHGNQRSVYHLRTPETESIRSGTPHTTQSKVPYEDLKALRFLLLRLSLQERDTGADELMVPYMRSQLSIDRHMSEVELER